jgi:hypothetical protein
MSKWLKLLISIDQFFAVLLLNAHPDQTISGHVGYKAMTTRKRRYKLAEKVINFLFLPWEQDHCRRNIEWDRIK